MEQTRLKEFTIQDVLALPDGKRAELIDGEWFDMATPASTHQMILMAVTREISNHIRSNMGECLVMPAPFAVFLNDDDYNYLEPDISVICDRNKIDEKGCHGAPDLVVEIVSPFTKKRDYGIKLFKYRTAGVKEYWIINPESRTVNTHVFASEDTEESGDQVSFDEAIPCGLFPDLSIVISEQM